MGKYYQLRNYLLNDRVNFFFVMKMAKDRNQHIGLHIARKVMDGLKERVCCCRLANCVSMCIILINIWYAVVLFAKQSLFADGCNTLYGVFFTNLE